MSINEQSYTYGASKSSIREIAAYGATRKAAIGAEKVFDFSLGNPSVPAPEEVRASIEKNLDLPSMQLHGYTPAAGLPSVRQAVATSLSSRYSTHYDPDDLFLTCGAAASLTITFNALVNHGDEVIVIAPYFPEYRVWIETAGAKCVEVMADEKTFQLDVDAISAALNERTKAVVIDSPNNPVGSIYPESSLLELAKALRAAEKKYGTAIYLVSDEPYREISYGEQVPWVPYSYDRTVVTYSYSKALSLPGERIGWVLIPPTNPDHDRLLPAIAGSARKLGFVCAPALFQRVIADCVNVPSNIDAYKKNRQALTEGLDRLGYHYIEPQGAFYLWMQALEPDDEAFFERARALELLPVPSTSFGCKGWVRLGYCVKYETIVNSMGAWKTLWEQYA
jgi:aspartate aminotransferase